MVKGFSVIETGDESPGTTAVGGGDGRYLAGDGRYLADDGRYRDVR